MEEELNKAVQAAREIVENTVENQFGDDVYSKVKEVLDEIEFKVDYSDKNDDIDYCNHINNKLDSFFFHISR